MIDVLNNYAQGFGVNDCLLISCGRIVADGDVAAYLQSGNGSMLRAHTYGAIFGRPSAVSRRIATAHNAAYALPLTVGSDYICAAGKHGNDLIHVADDGTITTADTSSLLGAVDPANPATTEPNLAEVYADWNRDNYGVVKFAQLGHGGIGPVDAYESGVPIVGGEISGLPHQATRGTAPVLYEETSHYMGGSATNGQDYYGILWCSFADGWPGNQVVRDALAWCKREWTRGNKLAPPHFRGMN